MPFCTFLGVSYSWDLLSCLDLWVQFSSYLENLGYNLFKYFLLSIFKDSNHIYFRLTICVPLVTDAQIFFSVYFILYIFNWYVLKRLKNSFFFFAMSNLVLFLSGIFFISHIVIFMSRSSIRLFFFFTSLLSIFNIWNTVLITVLITCLLILIYTVFSTISFFCFSSVNLDWIHEWIQTWISSCWVLSSL